MVKTIFRASVCALLAFAMAVRIEDGSAASLVQAWYLPVLIASVVILLALVVATLAPSVRSPARVKIRPQWWELLSGLLVLLPVGLAIGFKPQPLGAASLTQSPAAHLEFSSSVSASDPAQQNVYQWAYEFQSSPPGTLIGQPVDLVAFVFHENGRPADQFAVARFVVACCVADATGYTIPIQWPAATTLPEGQWVRVQGQVAVRTAGNLLVRASSIDVVNAPTIPYIYP
jgi:uncharacterized repeat protein (TIGR03943 family)